MKNFSIASLLESVSNSVLEGVAKNRVNPQALYIPQDMQIVHALDYIATGIGESFSREGNNAGKSAKAKSVEGGVGNESAHNVLVNSCVNAIMVNSGSYGKIFSGLKNDMLYVPRLPSSSKENEEAQWDYIESCPAVALNAKATMKWTGEQSATTTFKGNVTPSTKFYVASLLYGYIHEEQTMAVVDNGTSYTVALKKPMINLDESMKFLDSEIEAKKASALELLKQIHAARLNDFRGAVEGTPEYDIKDALEEFRAKIPADGNVFLSSNELRAFSFVLDYFSIPADQRMAQKPFNKKLAIGIGVLEKQGVHFGEFTGVADKMQKIIATGGYDVVLGYSQDGDNTHTEEFNNKGEKIFSGYITKYKGQKKAEVIPVYIATKVENEINALEALIGKGGVAISEMALKSSNPEVGMAKLNTEGEVKRTGGNDLVFQLPREVYKWLYTSQPVEAPKEKPARANRKASTKPSESPITPEVEPAVPEVAPQDTQSATPEVSPNVAQEPAPQNNAPATNAKENNKLAFEIINAYGAKFTSGEIDQKEAIDGIMREIKEKGLPYSRAKVDSAFSKKFQKAEGDSVEMKEALTALFGKDGENLTTGQGPLFNKDFMTRNVSELAALGRKLSPAEIKFVASKSVPNRGSFTADDVIRAIQGSSTKLEVRLPSGSFNLKAMLENINRK